MRGHALLLSNRIYHDARLAELPSAATDVAVLGEVLADPGIGDFVVTTISDVSCQEWREHIEAFFADAKHDETLVLFVSGHAVKDADGHLFFCAQDTKLQRLLATGVPAGFIQQSAFRSKSHKQIMLFDSCFAGAFARGYTFKSGAAVGSGEYFREGGGRIVITASDDMQYAFADDGVSGLALPSVFTKHLVEGLKTGQADHDGRGYVTANSLFKYVEEHVTVENPRQSPQKWAFGLSGEIVVASNPNPPPAPPAPLPSGIRKVLSDGDPKVVMLAVSHLVKLAHDASEPLRLAAVQELHKLAANDSRALSQAALDALASLTTAPINPIETNSAIPAAPALVPLAVPDAPNSQPDATPTVKTEGAVGPTSIATPEKSETKLSDLGHGSWLNGQNLVRMAPGAVLLMYGLAPFFFRDSSMIFWEEHRYASVGMAMAGLLLISAVMFKGTTIRICILGLASAPIAYRSSKEWWTLQLLHNQADIALLWILLMLAAISLFSRFFRASYAEKR